MPAYIHLGSEKTFDADLIYVFLLHKNFSEMVTVHSVHSKTVLINYCMVLIQ